ncbi:unnamed protein product, partial [marine sediment metagenome]
HIYNCEDFLQRSIGLLKENGLFLVIVPDAERFSMNPREPFHL